MLMQTNESGVTYTENIIDNYQLTTTTNNCSRINKSRINLHGNLSTPAFVLLTWG